MTVFDSGTFGSPPAICIEALVLSACNDGKTPGVYPCAESNVLIKRIKGIQVFSIKRNLEAVVFVLGASRLEAGRSRAAVLHMQQ